MLHEHTAPRWQDDARRRMRAGAARMALDVKREGFYAAGLRADDLARGHSTRTLERWARGQTATTLTMASNGVTPRLMSNADRTRLGLARDPDLDA